MKNSRNTEQLQVANTSTASNETECMHVAVVMCGERLEEGWTSVLSVMYFTSSPLHIHIITDSTNQEKTLTKVNIFVSDLTY